MKTILIPLLTTLVDILRSRASLHLEMLALRQQLAMVASRDNKRVSLSSHRAIILGVSLSSMAHMPAERAAAPIDLLTGDRIRSAL